MGACGHAVGLSLTALDDAPADLDNWRDAAACKGLAYRIMYPDFQGARQVQAVRAAQQVCNGTADRAPCPVKAQCLVAGVDGGEQGVWGGVLLGSPRTSVRIEHHPGAFWYRASITGLACADCRLPIAIGDSFKADQNGRYCAKCV